MHPFTSIIYNFLCIYLEYELVQNAFYTDPSDQSAWFYHKWLLGRGNYYIILINKSLFIIL